MRCPNCGTEVDNGYAFCTRCGNPMPRAGGNRQSAMGQYPGEPAGWDGASDDGYGYDYGMPERAPEPQRGRGLLYGLIVFLSVLLIAIGVLILLNMRGDKEEEEKPAETQPVETAAVVTDAPAVETPVVVEQQVTPPPTVAPTSSPADEAAAKTAVGNYLNAFITDVNSESYNRLYNYVQAGSSLETEQRNFINNNAPKDLRETLQDYQITDVRMQNVNCYYITAVESYSYYSNESSETKWVFQRCTYEVNRQGDGSWKLSRMVGGVDVLERGTY